MSLFSGTPATSYTTSTSETPKWMQDAIYSQIQSASNIANQPYQAYTGQSVAGLTPQQEAAYRGAVEGQGAWVPSMNQAMVGTGGLTSSYGSSQAAQGYMQNAGSVNPLAAAQSLMNQGLNTSGVAAAQPYVNQQAQALGGINYNAGANALSPYASQSVQNSGLSAAMPYFNQADDRATQDIGSYMNPYQQNVMDVIARQGARNLSENLLPAVSDSFIKAGQFGGTRMGEFGSRALRDTQESVLNQQSQLANQGYSQAMSASQTDLARQAQLGQSAGQLAATQQQALLSAGQALSGAQAQGVQNQLAGAGQYGNMASQLGNLTQAQQQAYLNAAQQSGSLAGQYASQQSNLAQLSGNLANTDLARQLQAQQQLGALTQASLGMRTADLAALEASGSAYQNQAQRELDASRTAYNEAQAYPRQTLDWLSTQIRGMAPITPQQTMQQTTGNTGASPLAQLASATTAGLGLYNTINRPQ